MKPLFKVLLIGALVGTGYIAYNSMKGDSYEETPSGGSSGSGSFTNPTFEMTPTPNVTNYNITMEAPTLASPSEQSLASPSTPSTPTPTKKSSRQKPASPTPFEKMAVGDNISWANPTSTAPIKKQSTQPTAFEKLAFGGMSYQ